MLTREDRITLLRIVDRLDLEDARFLVKRLARGEAYERALAIAARDFTRLRRRMERMGRPVPWVGMN